MDLADKLKKKRGELTPASDGASARLVPARSGSIATGAIVRKLTLAARAANW